MFRPFILKLSYRWVVLAVLTVNSQEFKLYQVLLTLTSRIIDYNNKITWCNGIFGAYVGSSTIH